MTGASRQGFPQQPPQPLLPPQPPQPPQPPASFVPGRRVPRFSWSQRWNVARLTSVISSSPRVIRSAVFRDGISATDPPLDAARDTPTNPSTDIALLGRLPFKARFACAIAEFLLYFDRRQMRDDPSRRTTSCRDACNPDRVALAGPRGRGTESNPRPARALSSGAWPRIPRWRPAAPEHSHRPSRINLGQQLVGLQGLAARGTAFISVTTHQRHRYFLQNLMPVHACTTDRASKH
jgi:hypothetical protein